MCSALSVCCINSFKTTEGYPAEINNFEVDTIFFERVPKNIFGNYTAKIVMFFENHDAKFPMFFSNYNAKMFFGNYDTKFGITTLANLTGSIERNPFTPKNQAL